MRIFCVIPRLVHLAQCQTELERIGVSAVIIEDKTGLKKNSLFGTDANQMQDSIENIDEKNHTYLYERDMDINRLTYLAFRLIKAALNDPALAKTYEMTGLELLHVYSLINSLEKVADQVKRISRCVAKFDFSKIRSNKNLNCANDRRTVEVFAKIR